MANFSKYIKFLSVLILYDGPALAQVGENLNVQISNQSSAKAASTIIKNINLITEVADGKLDPVNISSTIIADTQAAIALYQQWQEYQQFVLTQKISNLKLEISSVQSVFNRTPSAQLDDALDAALKAVDDLEDARNALIKGAKQTKALHNSMNLAKNAGKILSVVDTAIKAKTLVDSIKSDASNFENGVNVSNLAISTSITGMVLAGAQLAPVVGLVQAGVSTTEWYVGKLGDAVYDESNSRIQAIYSDINNANIRIQNKIVALHKTPPPPTDDQVKEIAKNEYDEVRNFVESLKDDVGLMEWLFGVNASNKDQIDQALNLIDYVNNNKAAERAIKYNNDILEATKSVNNLIDEVTDAELSLSNIIENVQLDEPLIFPVIDSGTNDGSYPDTPAADTDDLSGENTFDLGDSTDPASEIQDELIQDIVEENEPAPRVIFRGFLNAINENGSTTSRAGVNSPLFKGSTNEKDLLRYRGFQGSEIDDPEFYDKVALNFGTAQDSGYSYLYWGNWSGVTYNPGGPGVCYQNGNCSSSEYEGAYWIVGLPTNQSDITPLTGSAYFDGRARASSYNKTDNITGDVAFKVDFSSGDVGGRFDLFEDGEEWNILKFNGSIDANTDTGISGNLVNIGEDRNGTASGLFYGSDVSEIGGVFRFDSATGIFYAHDGADDFEQPLTKVEVYSADYRFGLENDNFQGSSSFVDADFKDDYQYTSWGAWGVDPVTNLTTGLVDISNFTDGGNIFRGIWSGGQITPVLDRPRTGSAIFNGEAIGAGTYGDVIVGDITMNANFGNDTISTDINLSTVDGSDWASATGIGNILDNHSDDVVKFSGSGSVINDTGTLDFSGSFNGPNANEVAGSWIIDGTSNVSIPGASGVFRAKQ